MTIILRMLKAKLKVVENITVDCLSCREAILVMITSSDHDTVYIKHSFCKNSLLYSGMRIEAMKTNSISRRINITNVYIT